MNQYSVDELLKLVESWEDPNPKPVVEKHGKVWVVRDDLLEAGSKIRAIDFLIKSEEQVIEWVFGSSPAHGYGQISLSHVCKKYGKKAVIFMAQRSMDKLHDYQKRGISEGGDYRWVPNGMLQVTQKRARDYVSESPITRKLLPLGLEHPTVLASMIKVARSLDIQPKEVWTVGSSGTLSRALQMAWSDADVHVVQVGHTMKPHEIGRAKLWQSKYEFEKNVKEAGKPPFPSALSYDAKAWSFIMEHGRDECLFWNVGA